MKAMLQQGLQSGTITPQTLKMGEQLCVACLQNPALYPNLRNFAIQRGLVKPKEALIYFRAGRYMRMV